MSTSGMSGSAKRICVIGANGQVGVEVSAILSAWPEIEVAPVTRSEFGAVVLRRLGLDCRHGRMANEGDAKRVLSDCGLVADFGWPGRTVGRLEDLARQIRNAVRHAAPGAPYVFISTQSVYQLDPAVSEFSAYRIAKLYAEKIALEEGRKLGRPVYVLRLGQVHGPTQSVSRAIVKEFRPELAYVPELKSYAVFTYTVAEALVHILQGKEQPGVYTLVSSPEWSWQEMHAYFGAWTGMATRSVLVPPVVARASAWQRLRRCVAGWIHHEVFRQKDLLEHWGMKVVPEKTRGTRLKHYRNRAAAEVGQWLEDERWRPYGQKVEIPGARLRSLSDVRPFILEKNRELNRRFEALGPSVIAR